MNTQKHATAMNDEKIDEKVQALARLLSQAGAAHGQFESTVLKGIYDQVWAQWYARWVVAHGFNTLVAQPVSTEELSRLLSSLNEDHLKVGNGQSWAAFTAERLASLLG